jgi:catechol 2,3-dioxygenase-like lactoylglutathione lyase family enzyme
MSIVGVHHVLLAMPPQGEDEARRFYGGLLGMPELAKPPALAARGGAWFRAGAAELHLGVEDGFRPPGKAHPALLVSDLDQVCARLQAAGVEASPDVLLPGFRRAYVRDPFGNRLELLEPDPA